MIISDLQHIEIATETEVNGGHGWGGYYYQRPYNVASADASAQAFGTNTRTATTTDTLVIQGQFSGSRSSSFAEAS
ncbi:MAG: hypothetical protein ACRC1Z_26790 [Waterburya sp.]